MKNIVILLLLSFSILFFGCTQQNSSQISANISQPKQTYACPDGSIVAQISDCPKAIQTYSCPDGSNVTDLSSYPKQTCSDGTEFYTCSTNKPLYCSEDGLMEKSSICGCPQGYEEINPDKCVLNDSSDYYDLEVGFYIKENFVIKSFRVYSNHSFLGQLNEKENEPKCELDCDVGCPSIAKINNGTCRITTCKDDSLTDRNLVFIIEPSVKFGLIDLVSKIKNETDDRGIQAVIAAGLTPYKISGPPEAYGSSETHYSSDEYITLVFEKYIFNCGGKTYSEMEKIDSNITYNGKSVDSYLESENYSYAIFYESKTFYNFLLSELGFGLADIDIELDRYVYPDEISNKTYLGIKCELNRSFMNTGYCIIANNRIFTDESYSLEGELLSTPKVTIITDGEMYVPTSDFRYNFRKDMLYNNDIIN